MLKLLKNLSISIIAVLSPIHPILIATLILVGFDFITGIWAAKKRGEPISSAGLRRTVTKLLVFEIALVLAFVTEVYMIDNILPLVKIVGALVAVSELRSCLENLGSISGTDIFKALIGKLGSINDHHIKKD